LAIVILLVSGKRKKTTIAGATASDCSRNEGKKRMAARKRFLDILREGKREGKRFEQLMTFHDPLGRRSGRGRVGPRLVVAREREWQTFVLAGTLRADG